MLIIVRRVEHENRAAGRRCRFVAKTGYASALTEICIRGGLVDGVTVCQRIVQHRQRGVLRCQALRVLFRRKWLALGRRT